MTVHQKTRKAAGLEVCGWLNTDQPLDLEQLKGKIVVIHAFQMLCPGCVVHGIPQTQRLYQIYADAPVQVIGLHSVFEHHNVMTPEALKAFVYENRLQFPIAIDCPSAQDHIPKTMKKYALQGTPSLVLIDHQGFIRLQHFGRLPDLQIGHWIGQLLAEAHAQNQLTSEVQAENNQALCDANGCSV